MKYFILTIALLTLSACAPTDTAPDPLRWIEVEVPPAPEITDALRNVGTGVYGESCTSCHGDQGRGDGTEIAPLATPPRDFSLALFKLRSTEGFPSDSDLYRSITVGFPPYGMPAFDSLPSNERWALVHHIKSLIQTAAPTKSLHPGAPIKMPPPKKYNQRSIDLGKVLYDKNGCAFCHGAKGDAKATIPLMDAQGNSIQPRNFREGLEHFKSGGQPEDIVRILMTGIEGTPMQSIARTGSDNAQLWDIAHYVHFLATSPEEESP